MEVLILGDHVQINEEVESGDQHLSALLPEPTHIVVVRVEGKVEHRRYFGQSFLAMSEIVYVNDD